MSKRAFHWTLCWARIIYCKSPLPVEVQSVLVVSPTALLSSNRCTIFLKNIWWINIHPISAIMIFSTNWNIGDSSGFKMYLLLLRNKCLRLRYVGSTLLSLWHNVTSHTALSPTELYHTLNYTSRRSHCMARKIQALIQPCIRSALHAQSMSLNDAVMWTAVSTIGGATECSVSTHNRTHPL